MGMNKPRNTSETEDRSSLRLVIATLVIGGSAVIALVYGPASLLTALPILLLAAGLILVPWLILTAVSRWRDSAERADRAVLDQSASLENGDD